MHGASRHKLFISFLTSFVLLFNALPANSQLGISFPTHVKRVDKEVQFSSDTSELFQQAQYRLYVIKKLYAKMQPVYAKYQTSPITQMVYARNGELKSVALIKQSGNPQADTEMLEAIRQTFPVAGITDDTEYNNTEKTEFISFKFVDMVVNHEDYYHRGLSQLSMDSNYQVWSEKVGLQVFKQWKYDMAWKSQNPKLYLRKLIVDVETGKVLAQVEENSSGVAEMDASCEQAFNTLTQAPKLNFPHTFDFFPLVLPMTFPVYGYRNYIRYYMTRTGRIVL